MGLFVSYCWTSGIVWKISKQEISKLKMNNTQQRLSNQLLVVFFFFFLFLSSASVPTFSAKGTLSINALEILYSREKRIFICEIVKPLFIF
jgi:hypothetical protein